MRTHLSYIFERGLLGFTQTSRIARRRGINGSNRLSSRRLQRWGHTFPEVTPSVSPIPSTTIIPTYIALLYQVCYIATALTRQEIGKAGFGVQVCYLCFYGATRPALRKCRQKHALRGRAPATLAHFFYTTLNPLPIDHQTRSPNNCIHSFCAP